MISGQSFMFTKGLFGMYSKYEVFVVYYIKQKTPNLFGTMLLHQRLRLGLLWSNPSDYVVMYDCIAW